MLDEVYQNVQSIFTENYNAKYFCQISNLKMQTVVSSLSRPLAKQYQIKKSRYFLRFILDALVVFLVINAKNVLIIFKTLKLKISKL